MGVFVITAVDCSYIPLIGYNSRWLPVAFFSKSYRPTNINAQAEALIDSCAQSTTNLIYTVANYSLGGSQLGQSDEPSLRAATQSIVKPFVYLGDSDKFGHGCNFLSESSLGKNS